MERTLRHGGLCRLLLTTGLLLALPVHSAEPSQDERVVESSKADYSGSLRATYDYRGLGKYDDHDSYAYWFLRGRNLADETVDIYTSGRIAYDMDGTGSSFEDDPFISLEDNSREDSVRVLQLYLEWHDRKKTMALRGGRQYVDIADYIQMDGLQVMLFENQDIGGRVFGGQPVSYYSSVSGDLFGGVSLVGRPWPGNQSRATYARYQDDSESAEDDHFFFNVRQQMMEELRSRAYLSVMNGDVRMGGLDCYYTSMSDEIFDAVIGVRRWGDYDADTRAYSPLVQVLGDQEPYTTAYGNFTGQLLPWLYLLPEVMVRYPDHSDARNREYERYALGLMYEPAPAFSASVALEYWDVENDEDFLGVSGDIRYRHRNIWELSLGAAYVDYTYFQYSDFSMAFNNGTLVTDEGTRIEVSPDAFTYFLRGKWNINKNLAVRIAGEIEDDSYEDDLGYRIRTSLEVRL